MWNLPISDITFDTIREFCLEDHKEDLDLDYKGDWPIDLARVICGMANVQGGMVLVGINAKVDRTADWPAPGVRGTEDQLHQRALQICYDAIYPPVQPEIAVCPLDTDPTRAVVVIRVQPSRLTHATDRRTRIYVRVADQGRGYELASLDQLEWLFQQRQKIIDLRNFLLDRTAQRASNYFGEALEIRAKEVPATRGKTIPNLIIYSIPVFPSQTNELSEPTLLRLARELPQQRANVRGAGYAIPGYAAWRTTAQGVFTEMIRNRPEYVELGTRGLVYFQNELSTNAEITSRIISGPQIMEYCELFLLRVEDFYQRFRYVGPILLNARVDNTRNVLLDHRIYGLNYLLTLEDITTFCHDDQVLLYDGEHRASSLAADHDAIMQKILFSLMWSFGFELPEDKLLEYFTQLRG